MPQAEDLAGGDPPAEAESRAAVDGRPTSAEVLGRVGDQTKPLNLNAEHQSRLNEALVKQEETKAGQDGDNRSLRKTIAVGTSIAIGIQIVVADAVFVIYGATNSWVIPDSAISAWLGAAVVQVIALGVIIVRSLFPSKE